MPSALISTLVIVAFKPPDVAAAVEVGEAEEVGAVVLEEGLVVVGGGVADVVGG